MAFSTNYQEIENLIPEGAYECVIRSAFVNATPGGALYFSVRLTVRNDVPQQCQNRNIYHAIWQKNKEKQTEDDKKVDGYSYKQLMNLCQAAGIEKGKSYETLDDLGEDLKGKCILVTVEHNEWNGKTSVRIKWTNRTKHPECKHIFQNNASLVQPTAPTAGGGEVVDVEDDGDLPFC